MYDQTTFVKNMYRTFGNIFKYDTAIQDDDATKLYLMCTMNGDEEYFEMIRFDEATLTLSFYRDHLQIKNDTPEKMIQYQVFEGSACNFDGLKFVRNTGPNFVDEITQNKTRL